MDRKMLTRLNRIITGLSGKFCKHENHVSNFREKTEKFFLSPELLPVSQEGPYSMEADKLLLDRDVAM
jgi:hypothetical protein